MLNEEPFAVRRALHGFFAQKNRAQDDNVDFSEQVLLGEVLHVRGLPFFHRLFVLQKPNKHREITVFIFVGQAT
jgi:hypothetical protein